MIDAPPPPIPEPRLVLRRAALVLGIGVLVLLGARRLAAEVFGGDAGIVRPDLLVAAALLWTGSLVFQALRWRALVPRTALGVPTWSAFVIGANVLNLTLPGPTGELVAALALHRRAGVPLPTALATSMLARVLALAVLGGLLLAVSPWVSVAPGTPFAGAARLGAVVVGGGAAGMFALCVWPGAILGWVADRVAVRAPERVPGVLRRTGQHLAALGRIPWGAWVDAGAWSAASTVTLAAAVGCAFGAVGASPSPVGLLQVHLLASLSAVAALVLPGGLGAMDGVYAAGSVVLAGVSPALSVQGALAVREAQLGSLVLSLPAMVVLLRAVAKPV